MLMKTLKKLKLVQLSHEELNKKELNKIRGGGCCVCSCSAGYLNTQDTGNAGNQYGVVHDQGGYGSGSFG